MTIHLLAFGAARDILGASRLEMELEAGINVGQLTDQLRMQYPALNRLSHMLVAVNTVYAAPETGLQSNDEIALIPPVSGG